MKKPQMQKKKGIIEGLYGEAIYASLNEKLTLGRKDGEHFLVYIYH